MKIIHINKTVIFHLLIISGLVFGQNNSCIECHSQLGGNLTKPVEGYKNDIHATENLSCADCHGGDPSASNAESAMDPAKGFLGKPKYKDIPAFCARCHSNPVYMRSYNPNLATDQESEYYTSKHGELLKKGNTKVATCTSCHGVHGIQSVNNPVASVYILNIPATCAKCHANSEYMKGAPFGTNQYNEYKSSVHGIALLIRNNLNAPACNGCHGNHGAMPPEVTTLARVCGVCHPGNMELFLKSPHFQAFKEIEASECATCHGYHDIQPTSDTMLGTGTDAVCSQCHDAGSTGYEIAGEMRGGIDSLKFLFDRGQELLNRAKRAGVEVSTAFMQLNDVKSELVIARYQVHSLSLAAVEGPISKGMSSATQVIDAGQQAEKEIRIRREWLLLLGLVIFLLCFLIFFKIRDINQKRAQNISQAL